MAELEFPVKKSFTQSKVMKGVYFVFFRMKKEKSIEIGALGEISFSPGMYVYVCSGHKSVEKRIERHFSEPENLHWHIDYFSEEAKATNYFILPEKSSFECVMAEILSKKGEPVESFGCSDCECEAHLFRIKHR